MLHRITLLPEQQNIRAASGSNLLDVLRDADLAPNAPCGGNGTCGKCKVTVDGAEVLACGTIIDRDLTVTLPARSNIAVLSDGILTSETTAPIKDGCLLAFDIGTTTVAGYLLDGRTGQERARESRQNPQATYGADVISRIGHAMNGKLNELTSLIRQCIHELTAAMCRQAGIEPTEVGVVSIVGNPAMQQIFLGIPPDNLVAIPYFPVLTQAQSVDARTYLPLCRNAKLLIVPNISGYVGADTVACVLATKMDTAIPPTLLVDIGTNGEMVLGNRHRMVACSTAAGPALEGANIRFGMSAAKGAIDHVWAEHGEMKYSVIGGGKATGICGSGLIDAVATALDLGLLNSRGRIQNEERLIHLTPDIFLTQEDIRQVQLAKGAIAAGIELMAAQLGISLGEIGQVFIAGAFGSFLKAESACRIGLLPPVLLDKITAIGNGAGSGAKLLACNAAELDHAQRLVQQIKSLELAALPEFQRCFARNMRF